MLLPHPRLSRLGMAVPKLLGCVSSQSSKRCLRIGWEPLMLLWKRWDTVKGFPVLAPKLGDASFSSCTLIFHGGFSFHGKDPSISTCKLQTCVCLLPIHPAWLLSTFSLPDLVRFYMLSASQVFSWKSLGKGLTHCVTTMGQDLSSCGESSKLVICVLIALSLATADVGRAVSLCQRWLQCRDGQTGMMSWWSPCDDADTRALLHPSQTSRCFLDSSSQKLLQRIWAPWQLLPYVEHDNLMLFATPFFQR